jgi:hypothetical protein
MILSAIVAFGFTVGFIALVAALGRRIRRH